MTGQARHGEAGEAPAPDGATLPSGLLDLLGRDSPCYTSTVKPDGGPHVTLTWVDTDGENVLINITAGSQKSRNIAHDPRVCLNISDPSRTHRYYLVFGHVTDMTTNGAAKHIDMLSRRYTRGPYSNYTGKAETRLIVTIAVDSVTPPFLDQLQSHPVEGTQWATRS